MKRLELYAEYTREEVNNIFNPETSFKPGTGTYGIHGLIRVPKENSNPDFIFFVNIGESGFDYEFTENISEDGKMVWQSQPSQTLENKRILQLINHDEKKNSIYLFIRHGKDTKNYLYLGTLSYVSHDTTKEKPVHFVWQILQWSQYTIDKLQEIGIKVTKNRIAESIKKQKVPLIKVNPPMNNYNKNNSATSNIDEQLTIYKPDYIALQKKRTRIGELGENLVFENEKNYLISMGYPKLAEKVNKLSDVNDRIGYDILSYDIDGSEKLIEVKTTTGGKGLAFPISANEVKVSKDNPHNYYVYRVFNYDESLNTGYYFIVRGDIEKNFNLNPTEFRATYGNQH